MKIAQLITQARLLIIFLAISIWHGIPIAKWSRGWRAIEAERVAHARKIIWELKCEGRIREDENGRLRIASGSDE